ncbi:Protein-disulfide isomerase [Fodinibius roseus]|uniref:Protein-disulfide isomerase n=1 Tax=Fodinibius roseus TaxID=1194090 RepID=A0A1M5IN80_9BACT|nr:vitamin K epoxide reductase family protein [Fodinibius roseus]SHG29701.1 Protein-disulfide isomerase [Fodinibius roseus]
MEHLVSKYLKDINLPISRNYCEKLIASHPDYPSMLSIADTLQRLGIRYKTARIEKEYLNNIEYPYLLWPDENGGEPKIVRDEQDLLGNGTQAPDNTETERPAIVLKAEPTDTITDEENNRQRSQDRFLRLLTVVLVVAVGGLIFLNILPSFTWVYTSLSLTALAGTVVGYLFIAKDVGISYKPVEAFCRAGKKTNCDALLNSEAARLFGDKVSFSDATASYFLFQLLAIGFLFPLGEASFLWILAVLSVLTIPIIGYSLWYQAVEAKTWCRLCLVVDVILTIQAGFFGYLYYDSLAGTGYPTPIPIAVALLLFGAVGSAVLLLKHKVKVDNRSEQAEIVANRIKNSPEVFMHLLRRGKRVDTTPFEQELFIGNPDATIKILMAASLGCGPCKEGFEKALQLVSVYSYNVNLTIRLRTGGGGNNRDVKPGIALLGYWQQYIHGKPDASERTEHLIRDWYKLKDLEEFSRQYPVDVDMDKRNNGSSDQLEDQHAQWMEREDISATPAFFINSYQLPKQYSIEDLMGILPCLTDQIKRQEIRQKILEPNKKIVPTVTGGDNRG